MCTLYTVYYTVIIDTLVRRTMYGVQCTLYIFRRTLYYAQCTIRAVQCTMICRAMCAS